MIAVVMLALALTASAQEPKDSSNVNTLDGRALHEVTVTARQTGRMKVNDIGHTELVSTKELLRAACCNLGESFTTNPSVDVNYADAATGARQIKLLGLSGTYVQMLTESVSFGHGPASPYALNYIPGPWMQSIQVSKGASSVKNGFESITGQINIELKKPQATPFADANIYLNSDQKVEANLGANLRLTDKWSTAFLGHYELLDKAHDDNGDGFADMPKMRLGALTGRWAYMGERYMFQAAIKGLKDHREGGQIVHGHATGHTSNAPYLIDITNERYEAFAKNALILDAEHGANIALVLSGSLHHENALYGQRQYIARQRYALASLLFETDFGDHHSLSAGIGLHHDNLDEKAMGTTEENTPGAYTQYTYKLGETLTVMGGLRWDRSSLWGSFVTPRMHLKYMPSEWLTLRGSAGKGYRTPHILAENTFLLASNRTLHISSDICQEKAWNYGVSAVMNLPVAGHRLEINTEYYYTHFIQQAVIDYDCPPELTGEVPSASMPILSVHGLTDGDKSYSHTFQIDATWQPVSSLTLTAAWRINDVKSTYNGRLREKPMNSRYKGLFTASFAPGLGKWQWDATLQMNGGGRMPDDTGQGLWDRHFKAYEQVSAQVTRFFRHWSIYAGGENLTGFKQRNAIIHADSPWHNDFDATMIWGPVHGTVFYLGARINWNKI